MGCGRFPVKGGTGQAPTSVYFGYIPDRFNMLYPAHIANPGGGNQYDWDTMLNAANNINQWIIYNPNQFGGSNTPSISLGTNTTAPDGSTNAQKIIAQTNNGYHYLTSGFTASSSVIGSGYIRFASFFKAAEYTRVVLMLACAGNNNYAGGGLESGVRAVFDLAGGQVGVANTAFGTSGGIAWTVGPAVILPFGNGWYCCQIDGIPSSGGTQNAIVAAVLIDAGSGTNVEDTSFTGDGSSGIYSWRSTCMPPTAWGFSGTVTFFDDFTDPTMADIDLNNTKATGFTWYINNTWPNTAQGYNTLVPSNKSQFSQSGSILTINGNANPQPTLNMMTAVYTGGDSAIESAVFQPPALFEASVAFDYNAAIVTHMSFWMQVVESLLDTKAVISQVSINFSEWGAGGGPNLLGQCAGFAGVGNPPSSQGETLAFVNNATTGYAKWEPLTEYNNTNVVWYNGVIYQASQSVPAGTTPPNATYWNVLTPTSPTTANTILFDPEQQNTYSCLWLPSAPNVPGWVLCFCNGLLVQGVMEDNRGGVASYTRGSALAQGESLHTPLQFGAGLGSSNTDSSIHIDWAKVTQ